MLTVQEWMQKMAAVDATHVSELEAIATVILEGLQLYGVGGRNPEAVREDMNTLATALIAYAKLRERAHERA